jgi:WD40 repeat protein
MTLRLHATVDAHEDQAWCVDWSPCGNFLASCSTDLTIKIWTVEHHHVAKRRKAEGAADGSSGNGAHALTTPVVETAPALPPASTTVTATQEVAALRLLSTLKEVHTRTIRCCKWSPCGNYIASCR